MLEELGHATVAEAGGKKQYTITGEGRAFLAANQPAVDAALARMREVGANRGSHGAPPIVRAMENLKLALRLRIDAGPLTEEQLRRVAEALDAAAVAVESQLMPSGEVQLKLRAEVPTESGSRYLQQLCKHWSHRFEVAFDAAQGTVRLGGACAASPPSRIAW